MSYNWVWTDDPLTAGNIYRDKVHFTELHAALWQIYTDAVLTEDTFDTWKVLIFPEFYSDASIYFKPYIRNDWIYEIRTAINNSGLLAASGYSDLADLLDTAIGQSNWTDTTLNAGRTFVRNNHIEDLRSAIDNLVPTVLMETFTPAIVKSYWNGIGWDIVNGVVDWDISDTRGIGADVDVSVLDISNLKMLDFDFHTDGVGFPFVSDNIRVKSLGVGLWDDYLITVNTKAKLVCNGAAQVVFTGSPINMSLGLYLYVQWGDNPSENTAFPLGVSFPFGVYSAGTYTALASGNYTIDLSSLVGKNIKKLWLDGLLYLEQPATYNFDMDAIWDNIYVYEES